MEKVTNKKGDKKGNKGRQEVNKVEKVTNKKGDKTGRQEGDTMTNKKAGGYAVPQQGRTEPGRQKERNYMGDK